MTYEELWQRVWEHGQGKVNGNFITVTETVGPIWDEISDLLLRIDNLEYLLRVEKAKNV